MYTNGRELISSGIICIQMVETKVITESDMILSTSGL